MNPQSSADALTQLQQLQSQSQDPNTILAQQQQQLGVNAAQQTVTGLRGAINNTTKLLNQVAPSVMGRTANSLVTNAQASKQIQNEQAPISANLTQEGTDYNNSESDLNNLQQEAQTAASGIYQGQQDKLSYAQNLYNTLYQQEQAAQSEKDQQAAAAEQIREFNANLAAKNSSSGGSTFNLTGTGATGGTNYGATIAQDTRGFHFTNTNGSPINAVQYAQIQNIPVRELLTNMANSGDANAKIALNYIGNDGKFGNAPLSAKAALDAIGASGSYMKDTGNSLTNAILGGLR